MRDDRRSDFIIRFCLTLSFAVTLASFPCSPAYADEVLLPVKKAYVITQIVSPIRLAGEPVFSMPSSAGGFSAEERAVIVERNMNNALKAAKDISPAAVEVVTINNLPVIRLAGKHIVTVDERTALMYKTSCEALAHEWAESMRRVLCDSPKVASYILHLSGDYLSDTYYPADWRERRQAARLNRAADAYRKDMPVGLYTSASAKNDGFVCLLNRNPLLAQECFKTALLADTENERARYGMGLALMKQGRLTPALMNLEIARFLEPDDAQVHIAIGEVLEAQGHDDEAIASFQTAGVLQPENPEPALYVADMREERDQISRSVSELALALMNCPDSEYLRLRRKDQISWRLSQPY